MNKEKQRIAVATILGTAEVVKRAIYDFVSSYDTPEIVGYVDFVKSPDYPNDLNACHEMEKFLTDDQYSDPTSALFEDFSYKGWIDRITGRDTPYENIVRYTSPTAEQRTEAFLRTLGKWEDEK